MGKSSLSLEYAHWHWAAGDYGLVWWVTAAEPAAIGTQLGALLAAQLEVPDVKELDPVAVTQAVLAARTEPWLLILDNAENPATVREFLPPAGRGHVLITSRNPNWQPQARLEVPDLDPPAAAAFLTERAADPDQASAAELAEQLGCLPLGLEQAGAYIAATPGTTVASYLRSYRRHRAELHRWGDPADYDGRIATTWSLALQALSPAAVGLLRLLTCYAPDNIPLALLLPEGVGVEGLDPEPGQVLGQLAEDELEFGDALAARYRYSLVRPGTDVTIGVRGDGAVAGGQGRLVSVHRLVQAVVLDQLADPQRAGWAHAARRLLDQALPDDPEDPAGWPAFTWLLPHLLATHPDPDDALEQAGRFLYASGDYRSARQVQEQVVSARRQVLGEEHPDTLRAQHTLACTLYGLGELAQARQVQEQVVQALWQVLGEEHPDTLRAQDNLAVICAAQQA